MTATHSFVVTDIPSNPYAAEGFLMDQVKRIFSLAHQADATAIRGFNVTREFSSSDPMARNMTFHLEFSGNIAKTFKTTTGGVEA